MPSTDTLKTPAPFWEPIPDTLLREIYDSDQAIYPAPELSLARLQSWAAACPELCLCLRHGRQQHNNPNSHPDPNPHSDILGVMIVLPLKQASWESLLGATIREHDVDPISMFPPSSSPAPAAVHSPLDTSPNINNTPSRPNRSQQGEDGQIPVGLHVFHIERLPAPSGAATWSFDPSTRFTSLALAEIQQRVADVFGRWNVVGYSALTATPQGHRAFQRVDFLTKFVETEDSITWLDDGLQDSRQDLAKPIIARMMVRSGNAPFQMCNV